MEKTEAKSGMRRRLEKNRRRKRFRLLNSLRDARIWISFTFFASALAHQAVCVASFCLNSGRHGRRRRRLGPILLRQIALKFVARFAEVFRAPHAPLHTVNRGQTAAQ